MKIINSLKEIILSVVVLIGVSACNDNLDVASVNTLSSDSYYSTESQIQQALTGVYSGLLPISTISLLMSEVRSDNTWVELNTDGQRDYSDIGSFSTDITSLATIESAWEDYYTIIANANAVLDKIDGVTFAIDSIKNQFKGEARFLRAFAYFDLVRYFGRVPLTLSTLTPTEAMSLGQSEASDIYASAIVPDLQYAIANLGTTCYDISGDEVVGKANKIAAEALLGKVYMTMAGFPLYQDTKDSAAYYLKKVIDYSEDNDKYFASSFPDIWISDNDNKNHIFEIQYISGGTGLGNPMVFYSCPALTTAYTSVSIFGNSIWVEDGLDSLYKVNRNTDGTFADARCLATIDTTKFHYLTSSAQYTGDDFFIKFLEYINKRSSLGYSSIEGTVLNYSDWPINYPLIRLEDAMLMYAEIVGPTTEGYRLVNKIRERAGLSDLAGLTSTEFDKAVQEERRRELAFEGQRWFDLVRRNEYVDTMKEMFNHYGETTNAGYVTANSYLYPIPETQMETNEGLYTQNPGYE